MSKRKQQTLFGFLKNTQLSEDNDSNNSHTKVQGSCTDIKGAMLMAIYLKGLDCYETSELTQKMKNSGFVFSWPDEWRHLVVDKHSTGGVGDKVSLILAPALAALGLKVPMISGRSLGHTGGTLDKLESIPGFRVQLTKEEIQDVIESVGCCIVGQTEDCVPADKVLYHCRDITSTINCPPLIIASIVSKKLSENPIALVYDVKYGKGSVFESKEEAIDTAKKLVEISNTVKVSAFLTSMENPLGKTIGNSLEVHEAIECLQGKGPPDVLQVTCALGCELLRLIRGTTDSDGENLMSSVINNGRALKKFHDMLIHQGVTENIAKCVCYGDAALVLPKASQETDIYYNGKTGYINEIDPLALAKLYKEELSQSSYHPGVGITLLKSVGDEIQPGEAWMRMHHQSELTDEADIQLAKALSVNFYKNEKRLIDRKIYYSDDSTLSEFIL